MDMIMLVVGIVVGVAPTMYFAQKKIKDVVNIVDNAVKIYHDLKKVLNDYDEMKKDGNITKEEIDVVVGEIKDVVVRFEYIEKDINQLMKRGD